MEQLNKFMELLEKQISVQKSLLKLENKKTDVLVEGNAAELDDIIKQEQPLIMQSSNVEKQRMELQKIMGIEHDSLRQIAERYKGENEELYEKYTDLSELVKLLKKTCEKNKRLLNSRLSVINHLLSDAGMVTQENVTYRNNRI